MRRAADTMAQIDVISSRANPWIKDLRRLAHEGAAYRKQGLVWVEGEHLLAAAVAGGRPSSRRRAVFSSSRVVRRASRARKRSSMEAGSAAVARTASVAMQTDRGENQSPWYTGAFFLRNKPECMVVAEEKKRAIRSFMVSNST